MQIIIRSLQTRKNETPTFLSRTKNARTPNRSMKFCYCKDRWTAPDSAVKPPATTTCAVVQRKFDGVAARFLSGFTAAFFASLERCSCINIATKDDVDDCCSLPLIPADVISPAADVRYTADSREEEDHRIVHDNKDVINVK
ncbi:hypothetical protein C2S53_002837 [Perilla frutescens var. hirtella]|uniref:Uncharacterized protein n=1 Tax=Perilla frutescens var. hirtella TaxID=608512 RepID=A0AAD4P378_PERFH|nr:hypothetical protein C2S53_002837 [Perilla frutescens var. hirtella]